MVQALWRGYRLRMKLTAALGANFEDNDDFEFEDGGSFFGWADCIVNMEGFDFDEAQIDADMSEIPRAPSRLLCLEENSRLDSAPCDRQWTAARRSWQAPRSGTHGACQSVN